jgi:hypothetical protein
MTSLKQVAEWLGLIESSLPVPQDEKTVDEYTKILLSSAYADDPLTPILVSAWARIQMLRIAAEAISQVPRDRGEIQKFIDELRGNKQTAQRTQAWYEQGKRILTASEIYSLFRSPRQRAQMVFSKVETHYRMTQPLAVRSEKMSAFDWGIRFEPVVKQIFELAGARFSTPRGTDHQCVIEDLGRILHPTDPRVAASPDGLITQGPDHLLGDLIEIKAPVTREIGLGIPDEYYAQMQTQLEVTRARACQYIEMKFASPYNSAPQQEGPALYSGYIYIVNIPGIPTDENLFPDDRLDYVYGPVNSDEPPQGEIVERVPWRCMGWFHQSVCRRPDWWASIQPAIKQFWLDVEGARAGTFTIPPSSRQPKKAKYELTDTTTNLENFVVKESDTLQESSPVEYPHTYPGTHADSCLPSEHNLISYADLLNRVDSNSVTQ